MINIDGYFICDDLRKDREDTLRGIGGGLLVYIKNGLNVTEVKFNSEFSQYCSFEVELGEDDIQGKRCNPLISLFYRSPNSTTENTEDLAKLIEELQHSTLIVGDLNLPNINWHQNTSDRKGQCVLDAVTYCDIIQLVNFTTHSKGNILDVAFAQKDHSVYNIEDIGNIGSSDHTAILFELIIEKDPKVEPVKARDWRNGDKRGLYSYLDSVEWPSLLSDCPPEQSWEIFDNKVKEGIDKYIPYVEVNQSNKPRWLTPQAKRASNYT